MIFCVRGGNAVDAVEAALVSMEDDPFPFSDAVRVQC